MRVFSVPAGVVEVADLAGAVVQVVIVDGALVQPREVFCREAQVQDREAGIQPQYVCDGVLVLPCRLGFLDDRLALELRETEVRDGVAERGFVVALVQGDGVAVRVVGGASTSRAMRSTKPSMDAVKRAAASAGLARRPLATRVSSASFARGISASSCFLSAWISCAYACFVSIRSWLDCSKIQKNPIFVPSTLA